MYTNAFMRDNFGSEKYFWHCLELVGGSKIQVRMCLPGWGEGRNTRPPRQGAA